MPISEKSEGELLALANQQLRLPPGPSTATDTPVLKAYLAELKKHTSIFPDDTHFYVIPQPGQGCGIAVCLEEGCDRVNIPLFRSAASPDGGKKAGIGSLMRYREHINEHPTHKSSRKTRISGPLNRPLANRTSSNSSGGGIPKGPVKHKLKLLSVLDKTGSPRPSPASAVPTQSSMSADHSSEPRPPRNLVDSGMNAPAIGNRLSANGVAGRGSQEAPGAVDSSGTVIPTLQSALNPSASYKTNKKAEKIPLAPHDINRTSTTLPETPAMSSNPNYSFSFSSSTFGSSPPMRPGTLNDAFDTTPAVPAIHSSITPSASLGVTQHGLPGVIQPSWTLPGQFNGVTHMPSPIASSSIRPLQMQMEHDPMFRVMNGLSGTSGPFDSEASSDDERYDSSGIGYAIGMNRLRDPVARIEELEQFFQNAGNAEQFDSNASVTKALERLKLPNLTTRFPGLEIVLMPHQAIGVAWMLDKEQGASKGGILSDEMGLGKTVQMIATIMANRSEDPAVKTTLIVAPLALLDQWDLEIETKTGNRLKVHIYHGSEKAKSRATLQKYDVVMTTFGTLSQEWHDLETELKEKELEEKGMKRKKKKRKNGFITSDSEDDSTWRRKKKKKSGLLFDMTWYRIVLDEAQNIRNKRSRISRAVTELDATYRWCLTGTPITNGLEDTFGLFRFLQLDPWRNWEDFYVHVVRESKRAPNLCTRRLQAILCTCLLRRRKDSKLDGKNLIELPPKGVELVKLVLSPEEQEIYRAVESRTQMVFNKYLRAGTVLKNYAHVLLLLLRLRQICTHTSLITEEDGVVIDDELDNMDEDKRGDIVNAQIEMGREFVDKLKTKLRKATLERIAAESQSADAAMVEEDCPICFDIITDPVVTACMHSFCRECITAVLEAPAADDGNLRRDERPCPACRGPISRNRLFSRAAFEPTDEELMGHKNSVKHEEKEGVLPAAEDEDGDMPDISSLVHTSYNGKEKRKSSGKLRRARRKRVKRVVLDSDEELDDDGDDLSDFIVEDGEDVEEKDRKRDLKKRLGKRRASTPDDYLESESDSEDSDDDGIVFGRKKPDQGYAGGPIKILSRLLPSTKMKHMMDSLIKSSEEHPDEKTMVISQWTQALDLVSNYLETKNLLHVKYVGKMSRDKRDKAVRKFMKNNDTKVMLMSLKCGGVGLNLTRANRVISLDLGWSEAVENQAFDRVHRLGQTRPVFVERLVIKDTVEDRVLALQEKKRNLAEGSLGEGSGKKIGRMTVRELANLFGLDQYGNRLKAEN